jgi:hypothetical protein
VACAFIRLAPERIAWTGTDFVAQIGIPDNRFAGIVQAYLYSICWTVVYGNLLCMCLVANDCGQCK